MLSKGLLLGLLALPALASANASMVSCWGEPTRGLSIDVDGSGSVSGALALPETLVPQRLEQVRGSVDLLVHGYDLLKAQRLCQEISAAKSPLAKVVFGGRERYLAKQGAPAWDWLLVSADDVAANLVMGQLPGILVGDGQTVVGRGLEKSSLTDPVKMALWLMQGYQAKHQPVVLFVDDAYQQPFFEFFSENPLPGVFLSFGSPQSVRDALNKHAKFSADEQARLLNYYCR